MTLNGFKTVPVLIYIVAILSGCGDKGTGNPPGIDGTTVENYIISYTIQGSLLLENVQLHVPASTYCNGDTLKHQTDTIQVGLWADSFELIGDTLRITNGARTVSPSQAVLDPYIQMIRKGHGTGIVGLWANSTSGCRVVSGIPTTDEILGYQYAGPIPSSMNGLTWEYNITSTQILLSFSGEYDFAEVFIKKWNNCVSCASSMGDSMMYDVDVQEISPKKLILTGNKSQESVTITWNVLSGTYFFMKYMEVFTSTNPVNSAYTYYTDPQTCPDNQYPPWYTSFLSANAKPVPAKSLAKKPTL